MTKKVQIGAVVASVVAAVALLGAQQPGPERPAQEDSPFRFKSGVELINVTATVSDVSGRFVSGLQAEDFLVYEDNQPVQVTHFSADRVPVSLGIALDTSGSMVGEKIQAAQSALDRFLFDLLDRQDEIFLYRFSNDPILLQSWTTDRPLLSRTLGRIVPNGGTAMYDTVAEAIPLAQRGQYLKKALVVISDGNDTASRTNINEVKQLIRESEVLVYAIGIDGTGDTTTRRAPPPQPRWPVPMPFPGGRRPGWPQPPSGGGDDQGFRFKSGVELINVTATVTDVSGRFVPGLHTEDFNVYEDDQPVQVTHFSAERVPVSLGIALDTSGSMAGEKIQAAQSALDRFLFDLLDKQDEIFLYRFSNDPVLLQSWTVDRPLLSRALGRIVPNGGTAMYDTIVEAVPLAQRGQYMKKALVVISDGNDTASRASIVEVKQLIRESEVLVYAIGIDGSGPATTARRPPPRVPIPTPLPFPGGRPRGWPLPPLPPAGGNGQPRGRPPGNGSGVGIGSRGGGLLVVDVDGPEPSMPIA